MIFGELNKNFLTSITKSIKFFRENNFVF